MISPWEMPSSSANNGSWAYPDPFFDIASTRLPKSRRKLFEMCYIFSTQHPQLSPVISKLAKFPVTRLTFTFPGEIERDDRVSDLKDVWRETLDDELEIYTNLEAAGLDFFAYGNAFITVHTPFQRVWECSACQYDHPSSDTESDDRNRRPMLSLTIRDKKFWGQCAKCRTLAPMQPIDRELKTTGLIKIVRIPPQSMEIISYPLIGHRDYVADIPGQLMRALSNHGRPNMRIINKLPVTYVNSALRNRKILFEPGALCHLWQPGPSGPNTGWGTPAILAGMKDAYLNQIYKKADESGANGRILPKVALYAAGTSNDPFATVNMGAFTSFWRQMLRNWDRDKNMVAISPFPVGTVTIGGDAQQFNTAPMRQLAISEIISSVGVPAGFLSEGMTWSGGSVQLRMIENMLNGYTRALNRMVRFVIDRVAAITGMIRPKAQLKPFRMLDDVQLLSMLIGLAQERRVSYEEVLSRMDLDASEQHRKILQESDRYTQIMVKEQLIQARVALEGVGLQVAAQDAQEGWGAALAEDTQDSQTAQQVIRTGQPWLQIEGQADQQAAEAEQQQQQAEAEQQQAGVQNQVADAQREQALARRHQAQAMKDEAEAGVANTDVLEGLDEGEIANLQQLNQMLDTMSEYERKTKLKALDGVNPDLAMKLRAMRAAEEGADQQADPVDAALSELRESSGSPEAMASKLQTMIPKLRKAVIQRLIAEDTQLAMRVIAHINGSKGGGMAGSTSGQSPKPWPERNPPRRA